MGTIDQLITTGNKLWGHKEDMLGRLAQHLRKFQSNAKLTPKDLVAFKADAFNDPADGKWLFYRSSPEHRSAILKSAAKVEVQLEYYLSGDAYKEPLVQASANLERAVQAWLNDLAPAVFTYQGFRIENPERLDNTVIQHYLDSIDYLVQLFKRRGHLELLTKTVSRILVRVSSQGEDASGLYSPEDQTISLQPRDPRVAQLTSWMKEILVHEIGHHIHLHMMSPEAQESWDRAWNPVYDKRREKLRYQGVTALDRINFMSLLQTHDWDFYAVGRKLKGLSRVKYLAWLYMPSAWAEKYSYRLSTVETQVRLTETAKDFVAYRRNPDKAVRDRLIGYSDEDREGAYAQAYQNSARREIEYLEDFYKKLLGYGNTDVFPGLQKDVQYTPEELKEIANTDAELKALYLALGIQTEYGETNHKEDFAEAFVKYLVTPQEMSEASLDRMQRSLYLSNLGGKPIMKLARKVVAQWLKSSSAKLVVQGGRWGVQVKTYDQGVKTVYYPDKASAEHALLKYKRR